jgi:hypothetical protein
VRRSSPSLHHRASEALRWELAPPTEPRSGEHSAHRWSSRLPLSSVGSTSPRPSSLPTAALAVPSIAVLALRGLNLTGALLTALLALPAASACSTPPPTRQRRSRDCCRPQCPPPRPSSRAPILFCPCAVAINGGRCEIVGLCARCGGSEEGSSSIFDEQTG